MTYPGDHRSTKSVFNFSGFRGRLVSLIVSAGLGCIIFNSILFYAYVVNSYQLILSHSNLPDDLIAERYTELYGIALALGSISLLVVVVVVVWTLYITQRVAGPIFHLQKVIESVKAGHLDDRIHLRAKDEFQDLARSFNEMMDELQKKP